jgi:hypothetical protein
MFDDDFFGDAEEGAVVTPKKEVEQLKVNIEVISLEDVKKYAKTKFNSNNHWKNDTKPDDYHKRSELAQTCHWIDKFKTSYVAINFPPAEFSWLKDAAATSIATGSYPSMYKGDLKDYLKRFGDPLGIFTQGKQYFVRSEDVSLKYGMYGVGPYSDLTKIIMSVVTCERGHEAIRTEGSNLSTSLKLYLCPWVDIKLGKEFRIFVYNNKITAISQQHLYDINEYLAKLPKEEQTKIVTNWAKLINSYFENTIKRNITHLTEYTIDLALLENDEPFFIEINCFGKEYAAGSSLFHWEVDEKILYDLDNKGIIHFRYVLE